MQVKVHNISYALIHFVRTRKTPDTDVRSPDYDRPNIDQKGHKAVRNMFDGVFVPSSHANYNGECRPFRKSNGI